MSLKLGRAIDVRLQKNPYVGTVGLLPLDEAGVTVRRSFARHPQLVAGDRLDQLVAAENVKALVRAGVVPRRDGWNQVQEERPQRVFPGFGEKF